MIKFVDMQQPKIKNWSFVTEISNVNLPSYASYIQFISIYAQTLELLSSEGFFQVTL